MLQTQVESANWFRSISLDERIKSLKNSPPVNTQSQYREITAYAQHRLKRWLTEGLADSHDETLDQFLESVGISRATFLELLDQQAIPDVLSKAIPLWVQELQAAYEQPEARRFESEPLPEIPPDQEVYVFSIILQPLVYFYAQRIRSAVQNLQIAYPQIPLDVDSVVNLLIQNDQHFLNDLLYRTLILELNVARMQGVLEGDTKSERFKSFLKRLRQADQVMALFKEYPVLARQITLYLQQWATASIEFLARLCRDWVDIARHFNHGADLGSIRGIHMNQGDRHHGGRAVIIVAFSSGLKLVYKPRSIAADAHFQELLTWLNQRGASPDFRTIAILPRETYGWIEFITPASCTSSEQVQRFYQRQGAYLALLYVLDATDFHHENLLAAGEYPILIDLEALFHPSFEKLGIRGIQEIAQRAFGESVLRIGLLPQPISTELAINQQQGSGLGSINGQLTAHGFPTWENSGTDEMRIVRKRIEVGADDANLPKLADASMDVLNYQESILSGFTHLYRLLEQHKKDLLAENSPIARFASDSMRVILRGTQLYGRLLQESHHPDFLRDCLDRDRLFSRLWRKAMEDPRYTSVAAAEIYDLHQNDVPLFTTRPNSRHIWTSTGQQIPVFFAESSMDRVHRRLTQLGDKDFGLQKWLIKTSLMAFVKSAQSPSPTALELQSGERYHAAQFVEAARLIGDQLEILAMIHEESAMWFNVNFSDGYLAGVESTGFSFYEGLCGICFYLAYLGHTTQEDRYTRLAKQALNTIRQQTTASQNYIKSVGAYSGWGGVIYMLVHLAALWKDPSLISEAEMMVTRLPDLITQDNGFDLISGTAGCLAALLMLYHAHPTAQTLKVAALCGDHLLSHARTLETGIGWQTISGQEDCLTGFSHGTAGIAWALLQLADVTGEVKFKTTALEAIRYERSQFLPEQRNWRNLLNPQKRSAEEILPAMVQWCHGAPGIGLARLSMLDDAYAHQEIRIAIETTLAQGFGHGQCLCHGDLGNLDLILQAAQKLNDPQLMQQAYTLGSSILESITHSGCYCGVPMGIEVPGLMTGIAGIGYGLLRLADPEHIPSVLTLDSPVASPAH